MAEKRKQALRASGGHLFSMAFLIIPILAAALLIRTEWQSTQNVKPVVIPTISVRPPVDITGEAEETSWLARAIYSESKREEEQRLVAWVIRNRVETAYRGRDTYKRVVLDPYQFSAFNPGSRSRRYYSGLAETDSIPGWQQALTIADEVIKADFSERPFPIETRHFYSERSMPGVLNPDSGAVAPHWISDGSQQFVHHVSIDGKRFRFYRGVM